MTRRLYAPARIAERAVVAADGPEGTPYQLLAGAANTFDLGSGSIWADMPVNPSANDTVTVKNARGQFFEMTGTANILTINANGHEVEVPNLHDTSSFVGTGGSLVLSHPRFAVRWIFLPGTPNGMWVIDQDYGAGAAVTKITADYRIHPSEIVIGDTTGGTVKVTVPEGLPDDSYFIVAKGSGDTEPLFVQTEGSEVLHNPHYGGPVNAIILLQDTESVTYVKKGTSWHLINNSMLDFYELFYLPVTPIDLGPGQELLSIVSHPESPEGVLFESNVDGLLTVNSESVNPFVLTVELQVVFEHTLASNNADVWARVSPVATTQSTGVEIPVPINAAFAHSRSGVYGDTRQSISLFIVEGGDTIGIYAEEVESDGGASDIVGLVVSFRA